VSAVWRSCCAPSRCSGRQHDAWTPCARLGLHSCHAIHASLANLQIALRKLVDEIEQGAKDLYQEHEQNKMACERAELLYRKWLIQYRAAGSQLAAICCSLLWCLTHGSMFPSHPRLGWDGYRHAGCTQQRAAQCSLSYRSLPAHWPRPRSWQGGGDPFPRYFLFHPRPIAPLPCCSPAAPLAHPPLQWAGGSRHTLPAQPPPPPACSFFAARWAAFHPGGRWYDQWNGAPHPILSPVSASLFPA
jgi:hypothetical protein